ncbi:hypothetical protein AGOR_G00037920 [Albula goreensis]|uniref:Uncharacterized protein n=1 Tax=Albula goreensis TaxID=1534307 RepID=A0A8T3DZH9_9TELE|nr:hypothetical protein AGOR_G00037920 [Albula goreensis]
MNLEDHWKILELDIEGVGSLTHCDSSYTLLDLYTYDLTEGLVWKREAEVVPLVLNTRHNTGDIGIIMGLSAGPVGRGPSLAEEHRIC